MGQVTGDLAELLGIGSGETVRKWLRQSEIDAGARAGTTSQESAEVKRLKRENADRSEPEGGLRWGVQPICTAESRDLAGAWGQLRQHLVGWVYMAFVTDAYARRILGWRAGTTMSTQLVLYALEQAIWTRGRAGSDLESVVTHSDRGSQSPAIKYGERLTDAGIAASVGSIGDSYDNALAETINGLYKTGPIQPWGPRKTADEVEYGTAGWVDCFNHRRLYEYSGDILGPDDATVRPGVQRRP